MMTTQTPQKTAIITGIAGQDGSYLTELLLDRGYRVVGTVRNLEQASKRFPIELLSRIRIIVSPGPVPAQSWFDELIQSVAPHEIYNLSGVSFVPASTLDPASAAEEIGMGAVRMLQAIRNFAPQGRLYQACSSELFGYKGAYPQNENTPIAPGSLYGASKAFAFFSVQQFREHFGLYCVSGIAYNHESPRRPENFVSRRISLGVAKVKLGLSDHLLLGDLEAKRDWGFAKDYVRAMWLMLQQSRAEDYVLATGQLHSVRDFVELAFSSVDLDWRKYVKVDPGLVRPAETRPLVGDASKAHRQLGWKPEISFEEMVRMLVYEDIRRLG